MGRNRVRITTTALVMITGLVAGAGTCPQPAWADAIRDSSWHLEALGLPELHSLATGQGITVAVIDSGVDATHQDLTGNVLPGVSFYDQSAIGQTDLTSEGHGTQIASLIAGHGHGTDGQDGVLGVAPNAKILPLSVWADIDRPGTPSVVGKAMQYAVDAGAQVINVSLTSGYDESIQSAIESAADHGAIVVAGVGNSEDALMGAPANIEGTVAVAGSDRDGNLGPETVQGKTVAIAAPEVDLVRATPGNGYTTLTSDSGATALVSGAVALLMERYPDDSRNKILQRLLWTTTDKGEEGRDWDYGWGVLNLRAALTEEPEDRSGSAAASEAAASASAAAAEALAAESGNASLARDLAILGGGFVAIVAVITLPIVLVIRRRRRRATRSDSVSAVPTTNPE